MPLQNRVQPTGEITAHPARGRFMGNRGILHDDRQALGSARWRHKAWVTCVLSFKGRKRRLMTPHRYTELFFLDEAVAFAAGHRPCGECRRADYNRFREAAKITISIKAFDAELHPQRVQSRPVRQVRAQAQIDDLPEGTFVLDADSGPALLCHDALWPYAPEGYGPARVRPKGREVTVLTPAPLVTALRGGYTLQTALTPLA